MEQNKIDWSGAQLFIAGVCCVVFLIFGMVIGAVITQKNVDHRIEAAQKEIRSEIQKIETDKQIQLDRLVELIGNLSKRGRIN